jgi:threonine dehydrogenase-like Zn-dependent dehydrogenase
LCIEVPDTVSDEDATFTRLTQVGAVSLQLCQAKPGDLLAIIGLGLVGNLAGQLALSRGYRVIGFDPSPARRHAAVECGLTDVADPGDLSAQELSSGAVTVLECSGQPAALAVATRVAAIRGEIFLVGAPWTDASDQPAGPILGSLFDRYQSLRSGWEQQLPLAGATPPGSLQECDRDILRRIALGAILTKPLLSDVIAPEQAACAYQQLHEDPEHHLGVVIDWLTAKNPADPANPTIS